MKLKSNISSASESFRQNQDANLAALEEVRAAADLAQLGGGAKSRDRHVASRDTFYLQKISVDIFKIF